MMLCGLRNIKSNYGARKTVVSHVCESENQVKLICNKSKPHFFSSNEREKTGVLRGYCRDKSPKEELLLGYDEYSSSIYSSNWNDPLRSSGDRDVPHEHMRRKET